MRRKKPPIDGSRDGSHAPRETRIRSSEDLGRVVRNHRKIQSLTQLDVAGFANTGNRFIIDLENGKPTIQLQKALQVLDLLGIDVVLRNRGGPEFLPLPRNHRDEKDKRQEAYLAMQLPESAIGVAGIEKVEIRSIPDLTEESLA